MPKAIEAKLKAEYPNNPHAVYGTLNKIGAMRGNKETAKGAAMERKFVADHPARNLGAHLRPKKQSYAALVRAKAGI